MARQDQYNNEKTPKPSRSIDGWTLGALFAVAVLFIVVACQRVWGADYWWQLATGRYVLTHGIPENDPFSYTPGVKPWIELRWLYCAALSLVVDWLGVEAAVLIKAAAIGLALGLMAWPVLHRGGRITGLIVLCAAILACSHRMFLRPEVVTLLWFVMDFRLLLAWRQTGTRWVWLIPIIQVVWCNSHTLYALGPVLTVAAFVCELAYALWTRGSTYGSTPVIRQHGPLATVETLATPRPSRLRESALLAFATILACLAQPYGIEGVLFPFQLLRQIRGTIYKEFISEFFPLYTYAFEVPAVAYTSILMGLCVLSTLVSLRRLDGFALLVTIATAYLAVTAIRNVPLFCLAAVYFVTDHLHRSEWVTRLRRLAPTRILRRVAVVGLMIFCTYQSWWIGTDRASVVYGGVIQFGLGVAEREYPVRAERFLREKQLQAPILNTQMEGAYLLAQGHRVFMDPRLEVYGEAHYARYLDVIQFQPAFDEVVRELEVRTLFIDNHSKLIERARAAGWALVYFDEKAAIYVRPDSLGEARPITQSSDFAAQIATLRTYLPSPTPRERLGLLERAVGGQPYLHVANLLRACGQPSLAEGFLIDALRANPRLLDARKGLEAVRAKRRP